MGEWWTYRPSDFLMFSAGTWGRLLQAWNRALWPWQLALVALALLLLAAAARRPRQAAPSLVPVLALAWAWVAWGFHWQRFALVNTGATWSAAAFGLQAVLLFDEHLSSSTLIAFMFIWAGLAVYSVDAWMSLRRRS